MLQAAKPFSLPSRSARLGTSTRALSVRVQASAKKHALITGGNTGIGYETALALCKKDYAVTIACKDMQRAAAAQARIRDAVPRAQIETVSLDLANLASVRDCAKSLLDSGVAYDVLLNNAGVMACPKMATKDGFEYQLGVNHLGHFLFTNMLLPSLTSSKDRSVRIINVASAAHMMGKIDFNDLMRDKSYQPWDAYGQSKLANVMFTYELARRLKDNLNVTINSLHPGVVRTELGRYMQEQSWWMPAAIAVAEVFFKTPEQGAQTSIYLASSPEVEGTSSKYFVDCRPISSSPASYDKDVAKRLFDLSAELTKAPMLAIAA